MLKWIVTFNLQVYAVVAVPYELNCFAPDVLRSRLGNIVALVVACSQESRLRLFASDKHWLYTSCSRSTSYLFLQSLIFVTIRKPNFVFTASSHELAFYGTLASHCCFVISTFVTFFPSITALVSDLSVFQYIKLLFMLLLSPQSPLFWFVVFWSSVADASEYDSHRCSTTSSKMMFPNLSRHVNFPTTTRPSVMVTRMFDPRSRWMVSSASPWGDIAMLETIRVGRWKHGGYCK